MKEKSILAPFIGLACILGLVTIGIAILKLDFGYSIAWAWVFAPLWIPIVLGILLFVSVLMIVTIQTMIELHREKKENKDGKEQ